MSMDNTATPLEPDTAAAAAETIPATEAASGQKPAAKARNRPIARNIADWKPDSATTMLTQELEICSPLLRRNINRMGIRAQLSLFLLQRILPESGLVEQAQRFETEFNKKMSELEAEVEAAYEKLRVIAKREGIASLPPKSSTEPLVMSIPIYSPGMNQFIRVVRNLDTYYCGLDYLWMNGHVSTAEQWERINHFRRALWAQVMFLNQSWQHARAILRDFQEGRRAARSRSGDGAIAEAA